MGFSKSQVPKILSNHESKTIDLYFDRPTPRIGRFPGGIWVKYFLGVVVLVECKKDKPYDPSLKVLEPILDDLQLFS